MRKLVLSLLLALATFATPAFAQTGTQTISTAGSDCSTTTNCAIFGVRGYPSIGVYINVGTSGTFVFEATTSTDPYDANAVWFGINDDIGDASSVTADGAVFFTNPGYAYVRIRASAISGDATAIAFPGFASLKSTATLSGASQGDGAIQDGSNNLIEATVRDLTNSNPLSVAIADANGDQVTSFGGGTQYNTGDADATPTGTVSFGFDGTNVRALNVDSSGNLATLSTQLGSWTVTANAGTNLNTSSLLTTTAFNTVFGSASLLTTTQADNTANTTDGLNSSAFNYVFDGTTWDRWTGAVSQSGTWTVNLGATDNAVLDSIADGIAVTNAGTFAVQAAQSGTWTVQPGNTANTTPWLTSISQGGNTAAVNASGQLSITCANCSGSGASAVDDAAFTVATDSGAPAMGIFDDTSPDSVDEGDVGVLRMTANRQLKVTLFDSSGNELSQDTQGTHGTSLGTITNVTGGILMGNASTATPTDVGADGDAAALWLTRNGALNVADGGGSLTVDGSISCSNCSGSGVSANEDAASASGNAGTPALFVRQDTISSSTSADGDYGFGKLNSVGRLYTTTAVDTALPAGNNNIGDVDVASSALPTGASTSANQSTMITALQLIDDDQTGASVGAVNSAASTNSTSVKTSAGRLFGLFLTNTTTTTYYLKIYNSASAPTCSSAPTFQFAIPPGAAAGQTGGFSFSFGPTGIALGTGIGYCITAGAGTDNTAAATGIYGVVTYK